MNKLRIAWITLLFLSTALSILFPVDYFHSEPLTSVVRNPDGSYTIDFHNGTFIWTTDADTVRTHGSWMAHADTFEDNSPTLDGRVIYYSGSGIYRRVDDSTVLVYGPAICSAAQCNRIYLEWDISSVPDNAEVSDIDLHYESWYDRAGRWGDIYSMQFQPSSLSRGGAGNNRTLYEDCGNGTLLDDGSSSDPYAFVDAIGTNRLNDFQSQSHDDFEARLAGDWYAIGVRMDDESCDSVEHRYEGVFSKEYSSTPDPTIDVTYAIPNIFLTVYSNAYHVVLYLNGSNPNGDFVIARNGSEVGIISTCKTVQLNAIINSTSAQYQFVNWTQTTNSTTITTNPYFYDVQSNWHNASFWAYFSNVSMGDVQSPSVSTGDAHSPYVSVTTFNETVGGGVAQVDLSFADGEGLSHYILSHNASGAFQNVTWRSLSGTSDASNENITLPSAGSDVAIKVFCNDTDGNWAEINTISFDTADPLFSIPEITVIGFNATEGGDIVGVSLTFADDRGLSFYILSHNASGSWANMTWRSLSGTSDTDSESITLPSAGTQFGIKVFCNDTSGYWATATEISYPSARKGGKIARFEALIPGVAIVPMAVLVVVVGLKFNPKPKRKRIQLSQT